MKRLALCLTILFATSCLKTTEQLNREKKFDTMSEQLSDSQNLMSDLLSQMKEMQSQLEKMNGRIEELEFKNKNVDSAALTKITEDVNLLKSQKESETTQLNEIKTQLSEQKTFLEKVTESLAKMGSVKTESKSNKKKSAKEELKLALDLVGRKNSEAKDALLQIIDSPELSAGDANKALHALGKIEFESKNYDQALVYFSKIYSKYPKASLAPSSLLFIGKSLKNLGKKDEAKEAFAKLSEDYPATKESKEAKKEL